MARKFADEHDLVVFWLLRLIARQLQIAYKRSSADFLRRIDVRYVPNYKETATRYFDVVARLLKPQKIGATIDL
jgi:CRP-like cAMP-binding protein